MFNYQDSGGGLIPVTQMTTPEIEEVLEIGCVIDPAIDGEMTTQEDVLERLRIELLIRGMKL